MGRVENRGEYNGIFKFLQLLSLYKELGLHHDVYRAAPVCGILEPGSLSGQKEK